MDEKQLYWAAALLEGEGWFGLRLKTKYLVIQIEMVDGDVISRFQSAVGAGVIKRRTLPSGKTAYKCIIANQDDAERIMRAVLPIMGARRQEQILKCLAAREATPLAKKHWTHCKSGHPLSGENLWMTTEGKYTKRRCRECSKLRTRKYRENRAAA